VGAGVGVAVRVVGAGVLVAVAVGGAGVGVAVGVGVGTAVCVVVVGVGVGVAVAAVVVGVGVGMAVRAAGRSAIVAAVVLPPVGETVQRLPLTIPGEPVPMTATATCALAPLLRLRTSVLPVGAVAVAAVAFDPSPSTSTSLAMLVRTGGEVPLAEDACASTGVCRSTPLNASVTIATGPAGVSEAENDAGGVLPTRLRHPASRIAPRTWSSTLVEVWQDTPEAEVVSR